MPGVREDLHIRAPRHQSEEAKRCAEHKGQTLQTFLHAAMMKAIAETKAEMAKAPEESFSLRKASPGKKAAPLGMRERLAARRSNDRSLDMPSEELDGPMAAAVAPTTPSVVINTGQASAANDPVPFLAKWVAAGESYQRRERLTTAGKQIAAFADSEEQRNELTERLVDEISKIDRKKGHSSGL